MNFQLIAMHTVIVILLTPLILFYALPFLIAARVFYRASTRWLTDKQRLISACGIAALGMAPSFDAYHQPMPIYARLLDGETVSAGTMVVSFLLTWLIVYLQAAMLPKWRHRAIEGQ